MPDIVLVEGKKRLRIPTDAKSAFPRLGQLYLELLENKAKVKPSLRSENYEPQISQTNSHKIFSADYLPPTKHPYEQADSFFTKRDSDNESNHADNEDNKDYERDRDRKRDRDRDDRDRDRDHDRDRDRDDRDRDRDDRDRDRDHDRDRDRDHDRDRDRDHDRDYEKDKYGDYDKELSDADTKRVSFYDTDAFFTDVGGEKRDVNYETEDEDARGHIPTSSTRLSQLLGTAQHSHSFNPPPLSQQPPSLNELRVQNTGDRFFHKDISQQSKSQVDIDERKRALLFKFKILRRKYKESEGDIPEWSTHTDLELMERSYDDTLRMVALDASIAKNKGYLEKGFIFGEQLLLMLGFDKAQNFAAQQLSGMNQYEQLLVELGEKQYENELSSSWPVEIRLAGLVLFNLIAFVCGKSLMEKTGINYNVQSNQSATSEKKMRGPIIDPSLLDSD